MGGGRDGKEKEGEGKWRGKEGKGGTCSKVIEGDRRPAHRCG